MDHPRAHATDGFDQASLVIAMVDPERLAGLVSSCDHRQMSSAATRVLDRVPLTLD